MVRTAYTIGSFAALILSQGYEIIEGQVDISYPISRHPHMNQKSEKIVPT